MIALADVALPGWFDRAITGPAVLIAIGAAFLVTSVNRGGRSTATAGGPAAAASSSRTGPSAATYGAPGNVDPGATSAATGAADIGVDATSGIESSAFGDDPTATLPPYPGSDRA
jgi:hypothetical protein